MTIIYSCQVTMMSNAILLVSLACICSVYGSYSTGYAAPAYTAPAPAYSQPMAYAQPAYEHNVVSHSKLFI